MGTAGGQTPQDSPVPRPFLCCEAGRVMISYNVSRSSTRFVCLALFGICIIMAKYAISPGLPINRRKPMSGASAISPLYDVLLSVARITSQAHPKPHEEGREIV